MSVHDEKHQEIVDATIIALKSLRDLPYAVQYRGQYTANRYETIAAFNVLAAARWYTEKAKTDGPGADKGEYRIILTSTGEEIV